MGSCLASVRDIYEIFASAGGFSGFSIECCQWNFTTTGHTKECAQCLQQLCAAVVYSAGGRLRTAAHNADSHSKGLHALIALRALHALFSTTDPNHSSLPWQRILGINGPYLGFCIRYLQDLCACSSIFEVGPSNAANQILLLSLVALATKLWRKWAISRLL